MRADMGEPVGRQSNTRDAQVGANIAAQTAATERSAYRTDVS